MAKSKIIENPARPKRSPYLCCFEISPSLPHKTPIEESNIIGLSDEHKNLKQKSNSGWFPWKNIFRFRVKRQTRKTVPLDQSSENDEKEKVKLKSKGKANNNKVQYHYSSKLRSKSNLHNKTSQTNIVPLLPRHTPLVLPVSPNQTPTQSQKTSHQKRENKNDDNDTCQKSSSSPRRPAHAVSLPTSKRQVRRLLSSLQVQPQTTPKQHKQHQNAKRPYNAVVGASLVMVTLVIMTIWGRFCAILCTSVWLYFVPRFRVMVVDDQNDVVENAIFNNSKDLDLDLDSVVYKKKVVLEGLLERNHSGVL